MPKIARITGIIALILPTAGIPLGLGDIELHSALNQPLDADIGLLDVRSTPPESIQVNLASRDEFEKMGLDRPAFLSSLEMELQREESGRQFIKLKSTQAIREPFIDVMLAVSWPQGRLVKEYTLLLDPPVFLDATAAPINAPLTDVAESDSAATTAPEAVTTPVPRPKSVAQRGFSRDADGGLTYGSVKRSDTLWSIAQNLKTEDGATTPQVMMALLRDNPEAFYNQNVNELKAGYVLRIRHPEAISAMSRAAAEAEIRRQYSAWRAAKEGRPINAPTEAALSNISQDANTDGAASGPHLELASVESGKAGSTAGAATGDAAEGSGVTTATGMRADLLAAIEASDVAQQENKALRERLAILEKQMGDMRRLLVLKGDTMSALQANGSEIITPLDTDAENTAAADNAEAAAPEAQGDTNAVVAVVDQADEKPAPVAKAQPAEEQGLLDQLIGEDLWYAVSGAGVLVLLLALFAKRRRDLREALDLAAEYPDIEEPATEVSVPGVGPVDAQSSSGGADSGQEAVTAASLLEDMQSNQYASSGVEDDDIDTLSEADVYLAYRRFDKAEQLLTDALQQEPDRHDLQLKLLEVYAKSENKEAFVLRAEALQVTLNDDESEVWRKVERLGQPLLGMHPLFGGTQEEPVTAVAETDSEDEVAPGTELNPEFEWNNEILADADAGAPLVDQSEDEASPMSFDDLVASNSDDIEGPQPAVAAPEEPQDIDLAEGVTIAGEDKLLDQRDVPLEFEIAALEERLASPQENDTEINAAEVAEVEGDAPADEMSDSVAAENQAEEQVDAGESEVVTAETEARVVDDDGAEDDMAWLDEVVDADVDDIIGGGEEMKGLDDDMDLAGPISGEDNFATNLDLARAYIDMGDMEAARAILEGLDDSLTDMQRVEIQELMKQIA